MQVAQDHKLARLQVSLHSSSLLRDAFASLIICPSSAPSLPQASHSKPLAQHTTKNNTLCPPSALPPPHPLLQEVYARPEWADHFDCVVTCFFIDTAHNVVQYVEVIRHCLKEGGYWLNLGPLLYHWCAAGFRAQPVQGLDTRGVGLWQLSVSPSCLPACHASHEAFCKNHQTQPQVVTLLYPAACLIPWTLGLTLPAATS